MFNLIMSSGTTAWETDQFMRIDASRFGEYSTSSWSSKAVSDPDVQRLLESFPSLLMYEAGGHAPAVDVVRYGFVREIKLLDRHILFRFDERGHCSRAVVDEFALRLGLQPFEQNRTHWAVKEGGIPGGMLEMISPIPFGSKLSEITRRGLTNELIRRPNPFHGEMACLEFLRRIWDLASMPSSDRRFDNAEADIWQHTVNNDDWDDEYLLVDYLGLLHCTDKIFLKFIEATVNPLVGDRDEIASRVRKINELLRPDGFRLIESAQVSSRPIYKAGEISSLGSAGSSVYEVVLSFAGEERAYVEEVADFLLAQGVEVFYDRNEEASLWGKDLAEHLDYVYRKSARYCVMFISKTYAERLWPNHERRSALARALEERQEYILPVRFDSTEVPGIRPTLGYVDVTGKSPRDLAKLILQKLGRPLPADD